jgi:hypothetical protein
MHSPIQVMEFGSGYWNLGPFRLGAVATTDTNGSIDNSFKF